MDIVEMNDRTIFVDRCRDHALPTKHLISTEASRQNVKIPAAIKQGKNQCFGSTAGANEAIAESRS